MTAFSRYFPMRGQFAELRQLQGGMVIFGSCLLPRRFFAVAKYKCSHIGDATVATFRVLRLHTFRGWW